MSFPDGTILDLDTDRGAYEHVGMFLKNNGAPGDIFSSLGRLYPSSDKEVTISKKVLFHILTSHDKLSQAEYKRNQAYNNTHFAHIAEDKMIIELEKLGILQEFLSI